MNDLTAIRCAKELLKLQRKKNEDQEMDLLEIALDLLGVPADNTVETGACDVANATGKWPEWGFCRDSYYNAYQDYVVTRNDIDGFITAVTTETI